MGNADVLRHSVDGPCLYTTFRTFKSFELNYPPDTISFVPYQLPFCHDQAYTDQTYTLSGPSLMPTSQSGASDCLKGRASSTSSSASFGSPSSQQSKAVIEISSADEKMKATAFTFDPAYIYDPSFVDGDICNQTEDTSPHLDSHGSFRLLSPSNKQHSPVTEAYDPIDNQNVSVCGYATDLVMPFRHLFRDPEIIMMKDSTRLCAPSLHKDGNNLVAQDVEDLKLLAQYNIVEASTGKVTFISQTLSHEELSATIRTELAHNRYVYIPSPLSGRSHAYTPVDIDMAYLESFRIWDQRVECLDYEMRFKNSEKPHLDITVQEFVENINDPDTLQVVLDIPLNEPLPHGLGSLNDGDNVAGTVKQSYAPRTYIHAAQLGHRSWGLLHHAGILTDAHHDAEGHVTAIVGQRGVKFWGILTLKPCFQNLPRKLLLDKLGGINQPNRDGISNYVESCDIEIVKLLPGDVLLQPPGAFHRVYTPTPSFTTGAAFFVYESLHWTELSRQVDAWDHEYVTNIEHDDPSGYQTLLRMMLAMTAMTSRQFFKRAVAAHCLMILAPQDYVYQKTTTFEVKDSKEEITRTKELRLKEIRALPLYAPGVKVANKIRKTLQFRTLTVLRNYVRNFKGDGPDMLVSFPKL